MFEHEPGVRKVECAPLIFAKGQGERIALTQLDEVRLSIGCRLSPRLRELAGVAFDSQNPPALPGRPRHGPRQLGEPAPDVKNLLAARKAQLP